MEEQSMSGCRRAHRRHRSWRRPRLSLSQRRLYRDPSRGRIAGVCAGLADFFQISRTMTRFIAVTALIFATAPTIIAYLLATVLLPTREEIEDSARHDCDAPPDADIGAERARASAFDQRLGEADDRDMDAQRRAARSARERLARIDGRLRTLEAYVTSRRFELDREFGKL
jgi:phage shock protein C